MILEINDWALDVDIAQTMDYSVREAAEHCTCGYCRNFYGSVDEQYPDFRPFLAQFGIDVQAPDELVAYDATLYQAHYAVSGKIMKAGKGVSLASGLTVWFDTAEDSNVDTSIAKPYFLIRTSVFDLPWVLDEPAEDVVSPANEPSFLRKIWNRLLNKADSENTYS